nr:cupredoxin family protein [uncultured Duganella sp.]
MKKLYNTLIAVVLTLALATVAGAGPQDKKEPSHAGREGGNPPAAKVTRSVSVNMNDTMRFMPSSISVKQGEVIRFVVKNSGKLKHEMVIGSASELKEHAQLMTKFPGMEHAEANQVTLAPGEAGAIIWKFDKAGTVNFACLQPGHFEAGMKGQVVVAAK